MREHVRNFLFNGGCPGVSYHLKMISKASCVIDNNFKYWYYAMYFGFIYDVILYLYRAISIATQKSFTVIFKMSHK